MCNLCKVLRASDLTAFTLLSAEGLADSGDEQDLAGIPECSDGGGGEEGGAGAEAAEGPEAAWAAGSDAALPRPAENSGGEAEAAGEVTGEIGAEVRYLETLGRLRAGAPPAPIGNLTRCGPARAQRHRIGAEPDETLPCLARSLSLPLSLR